MNDKRIIAYCQNSKKFSRKGAKDAKKDQIIVFLKPRLKDFLGVIP